MPQRALRLATGVFLAIYAFGYGWLLYISYNALVLKRSFKSMGGIYAFFLMIVPLIAAFLTGYLSDHFKSVFHVFFGVKYSFFYVWFVMCFASMKFSWISLAGIILFGFGVFYCGLFLIKGMRSLYTD